MDRMDMALSLRLWDKAFPCLPYMSEVGVGKTALLEGRVPAAMPVR
jgi:hypothetical protein